MTSDGQKRKQDNYEVQCAKYSNRLRDTEVLKKSDSSNFRKKREQLTMLTALSFFASLPKVPERMIDSSLSCNFCSGLKSGCSFGVCWIIRWRREGDRDRLDCRTSFRHLTIQGRSLTFMFSELLVSQITGCCIKSAEEEEKEFLQRAAQFYKMPNFSPMNLTFCPCTLIT